MFSQVITCVAAASGAQGPCPQGFVQSVQEVFLIPAAEADAIQAFLRPFDPTHVAAIFGGAFATTLAIWLASWGIGAIVRAVKSF